MDAVFTWGRWLSAGLLVAVVLAGCNQPATAPATAPPAPTAVPPEANSPVVQVRRGDLIETAILNAQLTPARQATLFFQQAGRLKNLLVTYNDKVTAGQVLAELEVGSLGTDVALAELAMRKARAKFEQLRTTGGDRFAVQLAQLDYDSAQLKYEQLQQRLAGSRLVAPFDGLVVETVGRPGENVSSFAAVVTVADPKSLQITAQLADVSGTNRLTIGQPATLILDKLPTVKLSLQVVQLPTTAATLLNGTPVPVEVARQFKLNPMQPLPNAVEIGMLGRVTVVLREKQGVLLLKTTAVRANGPRRYIQVVQGGRKRDVDVEVGIVTPVDTEIITGADEGDRVIDVPAPPPMPTPARKGA